MTHSECKLTVMALPLTLISGPYDPVGNSAVMSKSKARSAHGGLGTVLMAICAHAPRLANIDNTANTVERNDRICASSLLQLAPILPPKRYATAPIRDR